MREHSMTRATHLTPAVVLLSALLGAVTAAAESMPDNENGRYALSPVPDGAIRLDKRTGAVSACNNNNGAGWACYALPDERAAYEAEIGRLQAENDKSRAEIERLKAELASRAPTADDKITEAPGKTEPKVAETPRKIEIPLPSDRDMDRVMSFIEQAWRRLVEMAKGMQKDVSGKI
jgi:hypothetical protein